MAVAVGGLSGGALNPAVGILGVVGAPGAASLGLAALYGSACPLGAVLAAVAYRVINVDEFSGGADIEYARK